MARFIALPVFIVCCSLIACSSQPQVYVAGYYQEGKYHAAGFTPAYYDALGQFHPTQQYSSYYQAPRWHRGYLLARSSASQPPSWYCGRQQTAFSKKILGAYASQADGARVIADRNRTVCDNNAGIVLD